MDRSLFLPRECSARRVHTLWPQVPKPHNACSEFLWIAAHVDGAHRIEKKKHLLSSGFLSSSPIIPPARIIAPHDAASKCTSRNLKTSGFVAYSSSKPVSSSTSLESLCSSRRALPRQHSLLTTLVQLHPEWPGSSSSLVIISCTIRLPRNSHQKVGIICEEERFRTARSVRGLAHWATTCFFWGGERGGVLGANHGRSPYIRANRDNSRTLSLSRINHKLYRPKTKRPPVSIRVRERETERTAAALSWVLGVRRNRWPTEGSE